MAPTPKTISGVCVRVDQCGWPRWTRFDGERVNWILNEEEARDLHYALSRIVEFLDDAKRSDVQRGIVQVYG